MNDQSVQDVRAFWEKNPLWTGESQFAPGSKDFFEEHSEIVIRDTLAGKLDPKIFPHAGNRSAVLDLGCGPGFWTVQLGQLGCRELWGADLTKNALELAKIRCGIYGITANFRQENAECLSFEDNTFNHVNCLGVIHHTPDTASCVKEIARVLKPGGTATIAVYYRNAALRLWPQFRFLGKLLNKFGAKLKGRGRENIFAINDVDEIVRLYDGAENPIGKSYTRKQFVEMLAPHFVINETYLHFFPARALPFPIPQFIHQFLDRHLGFMIYANCVRK
jgi:2-polyprenyl-3-methyl-5-hydroxy-6-metoxy-1,4-benzoquinol methylase